MTAGRRTVLTVEDQPVLRRMIYHALKDRFHVIEAADSASAIAALEAGPVDLLLLDLHLPPDTASAAEGLRVWRRSRELTCAPAVVVMTADEDVELRDGLLAGGVIAFLRKPLDLQRLEGLLGGLSRGEA